MTLNIKWNNKNKYINIYLHKKMVFSIKDNNIKKYFNIKVLKNYDFSIMAIKMLEDISKKNGLSFTFNDVFNAYKFKKK